MNKNIIFLEAVAKGLLEQQTHGELSAARLAQILQYASNFTIDLATVKSEEFDAKVDETIYYFDTAFIKLLTTTAAQTINCLDSINLVGKTISGAKCDFILLDVVVLAALQCSTSTNMTIDRSSKPTFKTSSAAQVGELDKIPCYVVYAAELAGLAILGDATSFTPISVLSFENINFIKALV